MVAQTKGKGPLVSQADLSAPRMCSPTVVLLHKKGPRHRRKICVNSLWLYSYYTQSLLSKNKDINYIFIYLQVLCCLLSSAIYYRKTFRFSHLPLFQITKTFLLYMSAYYSNLLKSMPNSISSRLDSVAPICSVPIILSNFFSLNRTRSEYTKINWTSFFFFCFQRYQTSNSPKQNEHCLRNFDLSEYRPVFNDLCVYNYRQLIKVMKDNIEKLIGKSLIYKHFSSLLRLRSCCLLKIIGGKLLHE